MKNGKLFKSIELGVQFMLEHKILSLIPQYIKMVVHTYHSPVTQENEIWTSRDSD